MKIGIIIGSVREGRLGESIARWVRDTAEVPGDVELELIDLKSFDLPLFTGAVPPAALGKHYDSVAVQAWSEAIDSCQGYIFVTPEYNHGVPGAFKNAVDTLGAEWQNKPLAFVGYGADGGVRAVEQWRQIMVNFNCYDVRQALALSLFTDMGPDGFTPQERRADELKGLIEQLLTALR